MNLLVICQYFYPEQFRVSDACFKLATMGHDVTVLTGLPNYPAGKIFRGYEWDALKSKGSSLAVNDSARMEASLAVDDSSSMENTLTGEFVPKLHAYREEINGVTVLRSKLMPRKTGKINLGLNYLSFAYWASKTARALSKDASFVYDKILVFQFSPVTMVIPGIILKKRLHKPLFLYCFDLWPESIVSAGLSNHGFLYNCILSLSQWVYRQADTILISSKNFTKYFSEKLKIRSNLHYLPIYAEDLFTSTVKHSMDVAFAAEHVTDAHPSTDYPNKNTNLVFAGNIGEMQSVDTIVKAAKHLRTHDNIRFHIIGDGSALERSKSLTAEFELENITFYGRHPLEDMPEYYEMADAFLVTLKKDDFISYTLPGKVQSYMASGKPILAAIDGEAADVIKASGCGLCCPAEDSEGLATIILQFSEDKENRQKYGDLARAYYNDHFSSEAFFSSLLSHLEA